MGRRARLDRAPYLAGQFSSSVTPGPSGPRVAEDAIRLGRPSKKAWIVSPGARYRRWPTRNRLLVAAGSAAIVTAAAVLAAGATFGLFKATTTSQTSHFSTGTVTLTSSVGGTCSVSNMFPGSSSTSPCTLQAGYSGTVSAYLGLDVVIATKAGNGGTNLYNPSDSTNDLQITIKDNQGTTVTYVTPSTNFGSSFLCPSPYDVGGYTCYRVLDRLVSKTASTNGGSPVIFSTSVSLPSTSSTGYRGGVASVVLTTHAVQSGNNSFVSSCTPGQTCGAAANWS